MKAQSLGQKMAELELKIRDFGDPEKLVKAELINLQYAKNDLQRAKKNNKKNKNKLKAIKTERTKFKNKNNVQDEPVVAEEIITLPFEGLDSENEVATE